MANNLRRLLIPLLETRIGFSGTPHASMSAVRAFSSPPQQFSQVTSEIPSQPSCPPVEKDECKLNDNVSRGEDEKDGDHVKQKKEILGPSGPEPTRYGDWERNGRCYDF
ncbi:hypothetical protein HPP92_019596 [Vanilla planifolia]|uniref:Succinate dehydrogenase assembly factor 4, mitochondrial n=1 Tax=Vanilla planifolia TaxID=51239 RepID=A0A835QCR5_VANPL|nr:hypothetical protein HPP92_019596 [Vanilla planifolia]